MGICLTMIKMHISLADDDGAGLEEVSRFTGQPKSQLIREAVAAYLAQKRRQALDTEMRNYAQKHGANSEEFVKETRAHVAERLLRETQW